MGGFEPGNPYLEQHALPLTTACPFVEIMSALKYNVSVYNKGMVLCIHMIKIQTKRKNCGPIEFKTMEEDFAVGFVDVEMSLLYMIHIEE